MELRQLRHFVAVAEEGNISRAARKVFLTQPALSRQIKALEAEIGECLLERQAHSIRITPAGEVLVREARELLQQAERALEKVRAAGKGLRMRIGYAPSLAAGILSAAVAGFTQKHPDAGMELLDLSTAEMLAGLEAGNVDLAVTVAPQKRQPGLKWTPLRRASWQIAVGLKHPLARSTRVTPAQVAGERLLAFCQRDYPEYWELVTGWFDRQHLRPRIAGEYNGVDSLMAAVESGLGVALVTTRMAQLFPARARFKELSNPPPPLCIAVGQRTDRTDEKPLAVFIEELRHASRTVA